ncbi:MAG: lasso peptide biosynthesis PqqD family chaperone [Chloroflexi bacterium]|nr:lasso peptide biosynthesis PqqD family chaperone [Chloroflexota bacterium]
MRCNGSCADITPLERGQTSYPGVSSYHALWVRESLTNHIPLTPTTIVSRTRDVLFADVGQEVVMLNLEKGRYHALDEIATEIWEMIAEPIRVADLIAALLTEFDVSPENCQRDVLTYLEQLQERDLLDIHE